MANAEVMKTSTQTFRVSPEEEAEIDAHLQRVGGTKSDLYRNAVLARVRGSADFAEMLPSIAASLEREMAELSRTVRDQGAATQRLAAAGIAASAMLLDSGQGDASVAARLIEGGIERAILQAPNVMAVANAAFPASSPDGAKKVN
jgi:hypothetical protein